MKKMNLKRINKKILFFIPLLIVILLISFFCMPIKDGRSLYSNIQYNKKVAAAIQPDNYDKMKVSYARIVERKTGTPNFDDESDLDGHDSSEDNNYIRTHDVLTYSIEVGIERNENTTNPTDNYLGGVIKVKALIPTENGELSTLNFSSDTWGKNVTYNNDRTEMLANYYIPMEKEPIGGIQQLSFTLNVNGYSKELSGNKLPIFEIWMEGNKPDNAQSSIDSIIVRDSNPLIITGKIKYGMTLYEGRVNLPTEIDNNRGRMISFTTYGNTSVARGTTTPVSEMNSNIKLDYYYKKANGDDDWTLVTDDMLEKPPTLHAYGKVHQSTPNFWPNENANDTSYGGWNWLWSTYNGPTWSGNSWVNFDSGNINATFSERNTSFSHTDFYLYTNNEDGRYKPFANAGFEYFIPFYEPEENEKYDYKVVFTNNYLEVQDNNGVKYTDNPNSTLTYTYKNYLSGDINYDIYGFTTMSRYNYTETHYLKKDISSEFRSVVNALDGPYMGGFDRLVTWNSSLAELSKSTKTYVDYNTYNTATPEPSLDNVTIKYGIYKDNKAEGLTTDELVNNTDFNDFDWYDTIEEAEEQGIITAVKTSEPDYRGNDLPSYLWLFLKAIDDDSNIDKIGIVRHKIIFYGDKERTEEYKYGYSQDYTASKWYANNTRFDIGRPQNIGESFVITDLFTDITISKNKTNYNVEENAKITITPKIYTPITDSSDERTFTISTTIPSELSYKENSANINPTQIENNPDGTTKLIWEFKDWKVINAFPNIKFSLDISPYIPNNSSKTIKANITCGKITCYRAEETSFTVTNLSGSSVKKSLEKEYVESEESVDITNYIYNISQYDLMNVKSIEILPKNEDGIGSSFNGTYTLKVMNLSENQHLYYTINPINNIGLEEDSIGKKHIKNVDLSNDSRWIEINVGDTIPSNATAIASYIPQINSITDISFKLKFVPTGNKSGDVYFFQTVASSDNLENAISSEYKKLSVVNRQISGVVFEDVDRNDMLGQADTQKKEYIVELLDINQNKVAETKTDNNGYYELTAPNKGKYYIKFANLPFGYELLPKGTTDNHSKANANMVTDLIDHTGIAQNTIEKIENINLGIRKKQATLTIKHLDKITGNSISNKIDKTVYYTDTYETNEASDIPSKYQLDSTSGDPVTGTVDKDNIEVIYYYKLRDATLKVRYVDQNGNDIDPSKNRNESVHWGESYTSEQLTFKNYKFIGLAENSDPASGTISKNNVTVTYKYELKPSTLIVKYVDQNGNNIDPSKNRNESVHWGDPYTSEQLTFKNYEFVKVTGVPNGTIEADKVEVTYQYRLKSSTLIVKYVDQNGNNIDLSKNRNESVHWGDSYTSEQLTFDNYRFTGMSEDSDLANGTIEKDSVTVIYKYELKPSTITVHHYAIGTTTSIAPDKTYDKKYTEEYSTEPTNTTDLNYEYANEHDGDATSGTVNKDSYVINYYYKLKKGKVVTHHYLYNGEETTTKLAPDVSKEWNYTDRYTTSISDKVPKNYEFYKKTDNSEDYLQSPQVDVNYYYQLKDSNLESSITITGPEEITDKNKNVDYHIKYETSIVDYIGNGTVIITNALPYDIDVEKSDLNGGIYNKNNKTITWTHNYSDINSFEEQNNTKKITIEKDISLKYLGIVGRDRNMVSNVKGKITLSNNDRETTDSASTNIKITGKIIVKYVDEDGKEVFPTIEKEDLVGESFVSSANEKEGYNLIERPELEELEFEEEEQEVKYIYKRKTVQIVTKANTGGNITGDEVVLYGDSSTPDKIVIKAKDGYVIESVVINGEKIDIKPNQQQLVLGQFKEMKEDYLVEVSFKEKPVENPNTAILSIGFISVLVAIFFIILVIKKKKIYRI